jgi:hypothetical protein
MGRGGCVIEDGMERVGGMIDDEFGYSIVFTNRALCFDSSSLFVVKQLWGMTVQANSPYSAK